MSAKLSEQDAFDIADGYRKTYLKSDLNYQVTKTTYIADGNNYSADAVWEITFDVENWDDVWFAVVISDVRKEVLCCSNAWVEKFHPHLKQGSSRY